MARMVFINLPVADIERATAFYAALGATRNANFSDERAVCMAVSDTICFMLVSRAFFATFTPRPISDARATTEVLIALSQESRDAVDVVLAKAQAVGGRADPGPKQDHGFMYGRSVEDLDGHIIELMWMDTAATAPIEVGG